MSCLPHVPLSTSSSYGSYDSCSPLSDFGCLTCVESRLATIPCQWCFNDSLTFADDGSYTCATPTIPYAFNPTHGVTLGNIDKTAANFVSIIGILWLINGILMVKMCPSYEKKWYEKIMIFANPALFYYSFMSNLLLISVYGQYYQCMDSAALKVQALAAVACMIFVMFFPMLIEILLFVMCWSSGGRRISACKRVWFMVTALDPISAYYVLTDFQELVQHIFIVDFGTNVIGLASQVLLWSTLKSIGKQPPVLTVLAIALLALQLLSRPVSFVRKWKKNNARAAPASPEPEGIKLERR